MIPLPAEKAGVDNDLNEKNRTLYKTSNRRKKQLFTHSVKDGDQKKIHPILTFISNQETGYMIFT
ncbi:hypothetical protein ACT7DN_13915 [Bacillus paranthracis]